MAQTAQFKKESLNELINLKDFEDLNYQEMLKNELSTPVIDENAENTD